MNKLRAFLLRQFAHAAIAAGPSTFDMSRGPRQRRAVPGPAAQGDPRRGDRPARRVVHRRPDLAGRRPPRPAARDTPAPTPACTSTSARTSSTCPTRWKTCSPRPAPTGSPSPWPTRTSPSSPRTCARASRRTPAPRSSSPSPPRTPATWNATPPRCWAPTTCPTWTPTRPPPGWSPGAPRRPPSRSDPAAPAAGPGPGTARPQGGPRRPQRDPRHARHRPAAQGRRSRPPAAPPHLTRRLVPEEDTPCLPTIARPGRPRSAGRLARSPQLAAELAARLTARDRWLLRMLCEHRVLTTAQITQLAFGTTRAATARMTTLYQYRAVDRFRPLAPAGSSPLHFILDEAGAMLLAAEDGITAADLGYRRDRSMAIALSPRLAHDTGANGIFTALAAAARASGGRQALECWWGERRCAATWGGHARPDGYGRWTEQAPRPAGRRHRLLPRVRHRHRAAEPGDRQARRVRRPRRPHRHHHPGPVLAAQPEPRGRAARPAGRPAAARHPRRRLGRADPRRPGRDRRPRHQPPKARPGRPGCPPAAPARACGSPSSPRPAPPRPAAARTARHRAARPAAWPGTRRTPPRPPGTPLPGEPRPGQDDDD